MAFQLRFKIRRKEGQRKSGDIRAERMSLYWTKTNTIKRNTEAPLDVNKQNSLEINAEETTQVSGPRYLDADQNRNLQIVNKTF